MTSSLLQSTQKNMDLDDPLVTPPKQTTLKSEPTDDAQAGLYACFNPSALSLLAPQLLANQTAAAAALMAAWPIQLRAQLASSIGLPPHTPFFPPGWPMTPPLSHKSGNSPPPPTSPLSPKLKFLTNNNSSAYANNNHIVSTTSTAIEPPQKKKKKLQKSAEESLPPPGSISPPTSSSSPGSIDTTTTGTPSVGGAGGVGGPRDPSKDKVFTCKICSRSFGYKHVLQNHERTHTGEKPFECSECHKRFTRDHHLKTHMRLHTGEKPYSCSHCDRQFVQVANLRRHLRVHTGERPYSCELCQARFSDSNQLKAHALIHSDEKPFECEKCGGRFRRRHHLVHHKCGDQRSMASTESEIETPLNLSSTDGRLMSSFMKRFNESQAKGILHVPQIGFVPTDLPEQTEPEDLSMHSPKSPVSMDELEELEDAATLYARLRGKKECV